jgi:NAD(P)-dependent dehydrogenase (short-subunit alcohol dehydrogenase family)
MNKLMNDKVAIVAGSSRFVIHSIVRSLLVEGATVILPAKSADEISMLKESMADINTGRLVTLLTDYPDYDKAFEVAESIIEQFGRIDLAVICFDTPQSECGLTETSIMDWEKMIDHNITTFFIAARVVLGSMKESKHGMFISITNAAHAGDRSGSVLADLSSGMQTEMARVFCEEAKECNIKCYHLMAAHFIKPSLYNSSAKEKNGVANDSIGSFIIKLCKGETGDTANFFQTLLVDADNETVFVHS